MAIIGACVSPNQQDNENTKVWLDRVEEMVSDNEALEDCLDFYCDGDASYQARSFEALQAAYFVYTLVPGISTVKCGFSPAD